MRTDRCVSTLIVVLLFGLALLAGPAIAQEHPEHPTEHAKKMAPAITKADLAQAIRDHVDKVASENGGMYPLKDPNTDETLQLKLERVHEERLARTAPDTYFACVDFGAPDGTTYDVDFFMKGTKADDLAFQKFTIHKVNGEPRYTWYEEDGTWKTKPAGEDMEMEKEHEHPEHPNKPPAV